MVQTPKRHTVVWNEPSFVWIGRFMYSSIMYYAYSPVEVTGNAIRTPIPFHSHQKLPLLFISSFISIPIDV